MKKYFLCSLLLTLFFISAGAIRAEQNLGKVTITSISGPTYVNTGETVNWTINAQTTSRGNTAYFVDWQDGLQKLNAKPSLTPVFSHLFVKDGVYDVVFGVTDNWRCGRAGKENCEIMGSYAKKVVPVVVGNGLKSYTKLLSSSAGVARIKFAVPINPADLNSENIKYCIQRVGSQSCDIDPTGQYNFSFRYNPVSRILVVKVTNLTTLEKKKGLGPFKLGRILGFGGLKLNKINDSDSNLLAEMNVLVK